MHVSSSGDLLPPLSSSEGGGDPGVTVDGDLAPVAAADAAPSAVGRYLIVRELGRGGMGVVYLAYDPKLDRKVALKVLRGLAGAAGDRTLTAGRARLLREAQALAKLSHPNVVQVYDVDIWEGTLYLTMEYVAGQALSQWLVAASRRWRDVLGVFLQAGEGLAAAHERGIVHRDFKPGNVLVGDDGAVKVLDFGLAKREDPAAADRALSPGGAVSAAPAEEAEVVDMARSASNIALTMEGRRVGTPAYMSPEQHLGIEAGPAGDQFSFCVSLWEALYGEAPFAGETFAEKTRNVLEGNLREPPADAGVPIWVRRVLERGLAVQASDRFPSMADLLAALRRDPARRRLRIAMAAAVLAGVVGLGGAAYTVQGASLARCEAAGRAEVAALDRAGLFEALRRGFAATKLAYAGEAADRVVALLRRRIDAWQAAQASLCRAREAAGRGAEASFDARAACLQRVMVQTRTILEAMADPTPALVERAAEAVGGLSPVDACLSYEPPDAARDRSEQDRARARALLERVARAAALASASKASEAAEVAAEAAAEAAEAGFNDVEARALLYVADAARQRGETSASTEALARAARLAASAGDAEAEFLAYTALAYTEMDHAGDPAVAAAHLVAAEAAASRAGPSDVRSEILETLRGGVALARGRVARAAAAFERALALAERAHGPSSPRMVVTQTNLATALARLGKRDEARARYEAALAVVEETMGPSHPRAGTILLNLANLAVLDRDFGRARKHLARARAIFEGTDPAHLATVLSVEGTAARMAGDLDEAAARLAAALAALERAGEAGASRTPALAAQLAEVELRRGRAAAAYDTARSVLAGGGGRDGVDARVRGRLLAVACQAGGDLEDPAARAERCARAAALLAGQGKAAARIRLLLEAAAAALAAGEPSRAADWADQAREAMDERAGEIPPRLVARALVLAVEGRLAAGRRDEARGLLRTALAGANEQTLAKDPEIGRLLRRLEVGAR